MKWKITEYRNISALSEEIRCNKGLTYNPARWTSSYTQSTNMEIFASKFPHVPFPLLQAYSLKQGLLQRMCQTLTIVLFHNMSYTNC
ncbi:unnamed protein product [Onchocerca ochengi]|uniref:Ovule protein n=1 Tax=Onchocerca ochengi TaxID=42157 RepID=A0A182E296_ONCOC|nr:unnamed protein product [Onchocerca ochengi]